MTCRKVEGPPFRSVNSPPLPDIRVTGSQPFQLPGIDYAGPLYVRNANKEVTPAYSPAQQYEHVYESPDIRNV